MIEFNDDIEHYKDEMVQKMTQSFRRWLKNCFDEDVDDSGLIGFEAKIKEDKYQVVFQMKKNSENGWWNYLNDKNEIKIGEDND